MLSVYFLIRCKLHHLECCTNSAMVVASNCLCSTGRYRPAQGVWKNANKVVAAFQKIGIFLLHLRVLCYFQPAYPEILL